jgi:hypothetical protein
MDNSFLDHFTWTRVSFHMIIYVYVPDHSQEHLPFRVVVRLTIGPKLLPKRALHIVRSRDSSFRCEYPLLSLRLSSSFLRLLPRLLVTFIPSFIFPSITCCRRQLLRNTCVWQIQSAFRLLISCRILICFLTPNHTSLFLTRSVQMVSILLQHYISKLSTCIWSTARSVKFQHHIKLC